MLLDRSSTVECGTTPGEEGVKFCYFHRPNLRAPSPLQAFFRIFLVSLENIRASSSCCLD